MTEYVKREIAPLIKEALGEMPVVVITGMRQTGKSTMLRMDPNLTGRHYVSFDDFAQLAAAREDPDGFVSAEEVLTIDEAQKCPGILTAIKKVVDRRRTPGQFLLSGSANFSMLKGITETLAGRAVYFTLHPFTRRELSGKIRREPFIRNFFKNLKFGRSRKENPVEPGEVLTGGMPSVCLGEAGNKIFWFKGYEQTYLERDIRELSQIGNIIPFRNLLHLAALRTGQLLSPSQLGRDAKLNVATASRYLSLLETSFVIYRILPYLMNRATRLIKSPKMYISDSGIGCYLAGVREFTVEHEEPLKGAMFETYVAQNLAGLIGSTWPQSKLYFWNVQGRHEVDFVIEESGKCIAIEIKSGARWSESDLSGLRAFLLSTPHCIAGILAYNGSDAVRLGERLWAVPLGLILA